jgi:4,5-DOPA dioxygenase extradiol
MTYGESPFSYSDPDHFLPLINTLAIESKQDVVSFFNDKAVVGSLTMTSVNITISSFFSVTLL